MAIAAASNIELIFRQTRIVKSSLLSDEHPGSTLSTLSAGDSK